MDLTKYREDILAAALAGHDTPERCGVFLFRTDRMEEKDRKEVLAALTRLFRTVSFNSDLQRAREDIAGSILATFKGKGMAIALEQIDLALHASDQRTRATVGSNILDRIGLKPVDRQMQGTPKDFQQVWEGLAKRIADADETSEAEADAEADAGTGSEEVVSEAGLHSETESTDDGRGSGGGA